jgi:hypothetical protein
LLDALPSSQEMKVSMVNSLGRAPEDSPAPVEGAAEAAGAAEEAGAEGVDGFSVIGLADATAEAEAAGAVPLEGVVGVAGALPDPAPKRAGPGML